MLITEDEANKFDNWLCNTMNECDSYPAINDEFMEHLARSLWDDSPLGYEASHRLANWIFCHINQPKISGKLLTILQRKIASYEDSEEHLYEAFNEYKRNMNEIITTFNVIDACGGLGDGH